MAMATKSGWTVGYASKAVRKEMRQQPEAIQADFSQVRQMIEDKGLHRVSSRYKKLVRGKIWEMRLTGRDVIARALYLKRMGTRVIIVRVFTKKTPHIPIHEIELALKRAKEFENAEQRR